MKKSLLFLTVLLLALSACTLGVKKWPKAQVEEETFAWRGAIASRDKSCLVFDGVLSGNHDRLKSITVELEPLGDGPGYGCENCPFNVRQSETVDTNDVRLTKTGGQIALTLCGLEADRSYRYRLVAHNSNDNLADQATDVTLIRPLPAP